MTPEERREWEFILNNSPDEGDRAAAREALSEAGPSAETAEMAQGVSDVSRPVPEDMFDTLMGREPPGLLERAGKAIGRGAKAFGNELVDEVRGLGSSVVPSLATNPRQREIGQRADLASRKMSDWMTLGVGPALTDTATKLTTGNDPAKHYAELEKRYPGTAQGTDLIGGAASGLIGGARALGEGLERTVAAVAPRISKGITGRLGVPALSAELTQAAVKPEEGIEGVGGAGGMGFLMGSIPVAASAMRGKLQNAGDGWVGKYVKAEDAGRLPAAKALKPGQKGVAQASRDAKNQVKAQMGEEQKAGGAQFAKSKAEYGPLPGDVDTLRSQLDDLRQSNLYDDGMPANQALDNELAGLESWALQSRSANDLMKLRSTYQQRGNFKNTAPTDQERAARAIYQAINKALDATSSPMRAADKAYSQLKSQHRDTLEILGTPKGIKNRAQNRKAARELEHYGNDSVAAAERELDLEDVAQRYPEAMGGLEAKKALEATRLNTIRPQVRTNLGRALGNVAGVPFDLMAQYTRGGMRLMDKALRGPASMGGAPGPGRPSGVAPGMPATGGPQLMSMFDQLMERRRQQQLLEEQQAMEMFNVQ